MLPRPVRRRTTRAVSAATLVLGTVLAAPLTLAGTAGAATAPATAEVNGYDWQLTYQAAPGQTNKAAVTASLTADRAGITYVIDDVVPVRAGHDCGYPVAADHTKVSCTVTLVDSQDPYAALVVNLGDRDDTVTYKNATDQVYSYARMTGSTAVRAATPSPAAPAGTWSTRTDASTTGATGAGRRGAPALAVHGPEACTARVADGPGCPQVRGCPQAPPAAGTRWHP